MSGRRGPEEASVKNTAPAHSARVTHTLSARPNPDSAVASILSRAPCGSPSLVISSNGASSVPRPTKPSQDILPGPAEVWAGGGPLIHILLANPMGKKVPVAPILDRNTRFLRSKQGEQDSITVRIWLLEVKKNTTNHPNTTRIWPLELKKHLQNRAWHRGKATFALF